MSVTIERRRAARKPKLRPNNPKVRTMPARKRRTDRELKPAAAKDLVNS